MNRRSHSLSSILSRAFTCTVLAGLGTVPVAAVAADLPPPVAIIDANDIVSDHSQAEWSEAYLQWIASFPRGGSPVSDTTGALCARGQDGEVWFLALSDGTAPVVRRCTVPVGKTLFVPIAATMERSGNKEPDCPSMARIAAGTLNQQVGRLTMAIDGLAVDNLESHRIPTGDCFALGLRQTPHAILKAAVADGYYVMLKPLAAGLHTVAFSARFDKVVLSTTYQLDVH
ncbi:MAG: hypothetical protein ABIR54_24180 [Burkholderiaceae bacterium]